MSERSDRTYGVLYLFLCVLLLISALISVRAGALSISFSSIGSALLNLFSGAPSSDLPEKVFVQIRLPRMLLTGLVGASLALSGTLMQALFRNPIVEPGLVGTSAGSALGASIVFVLGRSLGPIADSFLAPVILPLFAFAGGLIATIAVYRLSLNEGRVTVSTMLLAGIAINGLANSGTGFLSYIARDPQARSITFWSLGSFAGSDWTAVVIVAITLSLGLGIALLYAKGLNALLLGDAQAFHLGVDPDRIKRRVLVINTVLVASATSLVGVISFIGLIVPHILRLLRGSDNRYLAIGSALLGASLMMLADTFSRTIIAPAELPVGIITSIVGAPVFLWMLLRSRNLNPAGGFYA